MRQTFGSHIHVRTRRKYFKPAGFLHPSFVPFQYSRALFAALTTTLALSVTDCAEQLFARRFETYLDRHWFAYGTAVQVITATLCFPQKHRPTFTAGGAKLARCAQDPREHTRMYVRYHQCKDGHRYNLNATETSRISLVLKHTGRHLFASALHWGSFDVDILPFIWHFTRLETSHTKALLRGTQRPPLTYTPATR